MPKAVDNAVGLEPTTRRATIILDQEKKSARAVEARARLDHGVDFVLVRKIPKQTEIPVRIFVVVGLVAKLNVHLRLRRVKGRAQAYDAAAAFVLIVIR